MAANFIILADDYQALEDKINEIKNSLEIATTVDTYDLTEDSLYSLIDELTTISLFGETKFVVAKNANEIIAKEQNGFKELLKTMNDQNSDNVLVLVFMGNVDFGNSQYQSLKRFATTFDVRVKNLSLDEYAKKKLQEDGFIINDAAMKLLVSYSDGITKLKNNIEQLECFKALEKEITEADIFKLIAAPLDDDVYALIEAVLSNNKKQMLKGYKDLKLRSILASNLVSLFINKFQEIYNVSILVQKGYNQASIADLLNVSSGRAYYMIKNAKSYNLSHIKKQLNLLYDLDYKIKTGQIDQDLGLELYFLNQLFIILYSTPKVGLE